MIKLACKSNCKPLYKKEECEALLFFIERGGVQSTHPLSWLKYGVKYYKLCNKYGVKCYICGKYTAK